MSAHPRGHRSHVPKRGGAQRYAARKKDKLVAQAKRLEAELRSPAMPNRVLTEDEILEVRRGVTDFYHGIENTPNLLDFARRIEALVIERIEKATKVAAMRQHIDERLTLGKHEGAEDGMSGGASIELQEATVRPAGQETGNDAAGVTLRREQPARHPSDSLAQDDPEYAACPHNREKVCAECQRVIAEGRPR